MTHVRGQAELRLKLHAMQRAIEDQLQDALEKAAEPIAKEAKARAPRRTGAVKATMAVRPVKDRDNYQASVEVGPAEKLWYGVFPEYGTSETPAQPFLRPALDTKQQQALRIFERELKRSVT